MISIEITPAKESGAEISACIIGHAAPISESGKPRLINATYITAIKIETIL